MASRKKPDDVYATRQGGGASIPDYFSDARGEQGSAVPLRLKKWA